MFTIANDYYHGNLYEFHKFQEIHQLPYIVQVGLLNIFHTISAESSNNIDIKMHATAQFLS